jgi:DNA repair photolyase
MIAKRPAAASGSGSQGRIRRPRSHAVSHPADNNCKFESMNRPRAPKGRGASSNPKNRFVAMHAEPVDDADAAPDADRPSPATQVFRDDAKSIIASNDSPDVPFDRSINPYRGCEHGCVYCYARPTHEYLGLSAGIDFETKIFVKYDAPKLLRRELADPAWVPQPLGISGVTDAWQPIERELRLTRACLEVCAEFANPVMVITKNDLVTRDIDVLQTLAAKGAAAAAISVTTLDTRLAARLEPRASTPRRRLLAIESLAKAGIPVSVLVAPAIPGLNDHEIPAILRAARSAGACRAGYVLLRLPHGLQEVFAGWLEQHAPNSKNRVLNRVASTRGGRLNDPRFGTRMRGEGAHADQIAGMMALWRRRLGFDAGFTPLNRGAFRRPCAPGGQLLLF